MRVAHVLRFPGRARRAAAACLPASPSSSPFLFFFVSSPLLSIFAPVLMLLTGPGPASAQRSDPLRMPLPPEVSRLLAEELSGQEAFANLVKLAGAPWLRSPEELSGEGYFHEAEVLYRLARSYGIETVRLDRHEAEGTFDYPAAGELWVGGRRIARIPADPALVASGSRTSEVRGPLIYVAAGGEEAVNELEAEVTAAPERFRGAVALMWSHPRGALFEALDRAGVQAVISFAARDRYFDPDQVVYARGSYAQGEHLRAGFTVSWRQWSELLEDLERGRAFEVRGRVETAAYPNRFETVYAWIPGTEPEGKGVVFTAHLFEGYTKRGANDNAGGPAIQLEILRALHHLIATGQLPQPRRTIHFIWPNEISGTYEFLRRDPSLVDRLAININMDMVSEGLRNANSVFTMSETPVQLASFYDGLAYAVMNYLWRTNDIVYLPDSPRGRPGGQYFPDPLWEKNGSRDAFRFFIHEATGGSDHIVFNNPSVGVPGIEFFTWPDPWYHADKDLPANADPTEMRRVAFLGAATAWVSANLGDDELPLLLNAVSDYGYRRVAERGLPRALEALDSAAQEVLDSAAQEVLDSAAQEALDSAAQEALDSAAQEALRPAPGGTASALTGGRSLRPLRSGGAPATEASSRAGRVSAVGLPSLESRDPVEGLSSPGDRSSANERGSATAPAEQDRKAVARVWYMLAAALKREIDAVASVRDIHTGSEEAERMVAQRMAEWEGYGESLRGFLLSAARSRGLEVDSLPPMTEVERRAESIVPRLAPGIRAVETSLARFEPAQAWFREHPGAVEELGLPQGADTEILKFVNGKRSVTSILYWVRGTTGEDLALEQVLGYLRILQEIGWIEM